MDLENALYLGITDRSRASEGGLLANVVSELVGLLGTTPPAGISARTWRRVRANPGGSFALKTREALRDAQRAGRVPPERLDMLRGTPIIGVHALVRISRDIRERKIILSNWTSPDTGTAAGDGTGLMRRVLVPWLKRDDQTAAGVFLAAISAGLTGDAGGRREVELVDVYEVRFWPPDEEGARDAYMWEVT